MSTETRGTLARRLGLTEHLSPLRFKLARLWRAWPCEGCSCIEDWLVAIANARGARVVVLPHADSACMTLPGTEILSTEELVVALCQPNGLDRPQVLRLAAQFVSRGSLRLAPLRLIAVRERAGVVLAELSRQALRVEPLHAVWLSVQAAFADQPPLREPLLHWTRLAEPVMVRGRCNAERWELVA